MNNFEIKHLRMISTIAETQNMTRAAEKLCITQSGLSQQLKHIETRLMANLFFRTKRKMILTSTGRRVLKAANHVIEVLDDTELEIAKIVNGDRGELKVGTQCMFCYKWLPDVIAVFQNKFPNIEFEIGNSEHVFKELSSEKFDFIVTGMPKNDDTLNYIPLFSDQIVCIMPNGHPLTTKSNIQFSDFDDENIIFNSERGKDMFFKDALRFGNIKPKRSMIVGQAQAIIELVATGFGISFYPRWAAQTFIEQKKIAARPLTRPGLNLTWAVAHLKDRDITLPHKEFIHIISKLNLTIQDQ
jgi:LysR family transcriptional regulator, regulator for metE and metH